METTSKRAAASRANGAKSHGPRTDAGKKRSSLNAIRHGYLSKCVVLGSENKDAFKAHHENYIKTFNPTGGVEEDLVDEMVSAQWRLSRLVAVETELFDKAFAKSPSLSGAFSELATNNEFALVHRYQSSIHRMFQRSYKNLILLRQFKAQEGSEDLPNEPEQEATAGAKKDLPDEPNSELPNEPQNQIPNEPNSTPEPESEKPNEPKLDETNSVPLPNDPSPVPSPAPSPRNDSSSRIPPGTRWSCHDILDAIRREQGLL